MAVPKQKISKSRRGQRRSHDALKNPNWIENPTTGNPVRPHHIDLSSGTYRGRKVIDTDS